MCQYGVVVGDGGGRVQVHGMMIPHHVFEDTNSFTGSLLVLVDVSEQNLYTMR